MLLTIALSIFLILVLVPALLILQLFIISRRPQHSIIRAHPILGWLRYLLEKLGPEFRQYWFDEDGAGKPFSRYEFLGLVFSAKYRSDLIGFGSKRDFESSGYYIANAMFPLLNDQLEVNNKELVDSKKYVIQSEGVFKRKEYIQSDQTAKWLYSDEDAIVVGVQREKPRKLNGMFGAAGLASPRHFTREHIIYKNEFGRTEKLSDLFPIPDRTMICMYPNPLISLPERG